MRSRAAKRAGQRAAQIRVSAAVLSPEFEITPEMIEAGADVLREYGDIGPYSSKHLAEWVWKAMFAKFREQNHPSVSQSPKIPVSSCLSRET